MITREIHTQHLSAISRHQTRNLLSSTDVHTHHLSVTGRSCREAHIRLMSRHESTHAGRLISFLLIHGYSCQEAHIPLRSSCQVSMRAKLSSTSTSWRCCSLACLTSSSMLLQLPSLHSSLQQIGARRRKYLSLWWLL